jgi:bifunctional non-homologous end joining protein LigD
MLATGGDLPLGPGWAYELKWDGVRALAVVTGTSLRLYARSGAEITIAYPELAGLGRALAAAGVERALLDGEIVALGTDGTPSFVALAERMHVRDRSRAAALAASTPVTFMIFDILRLGEEDTTGLPYARRRELLDSLGATLPPGAWVVPPRFDDGAATLAASREMALEGVVAKRLESVYRPGLRSPDWVKVKLDRTGDYVVGGWRPGARPLGALLIGVALPDGRLDYRGRVGGGISDAAQRELLKRLEPLRADVSPFAEALPREDARGATFVRPSLVVEVRYGNLTSDRRLRFPRFVRLRPDKSPEETSDE